MKRSIIITTLMATLVYVLPAQPDIKVQIGHSGRVLSVAKSYDGKYVATGSMDQTAKLWNVALQKELITFSGHSGQVGAVCFTPDNKFIITGSGDKTIKVWNIAERRLQSTFLGHTNEVLSLDASADGRHIVSGSWDGTVKVWDLANGREIVSIKVGFIVNAVCFSQDGNYIISGSQDGKLQIWEVYSGKRVKSLKGHSSGITSVSVSSDGRFIATGSYDKNIVIWDFVSGKNLRTLKGHNASISSIGFSDDGVLLISSSIDRTIQVWEVSTGRTIKTLRGHSDEVTSVCFMPDGKTVLSGSWDATIGIWDIATGNQIGQLASVFSRVRSVAIAPNQRMLAIGTYDNAVKCFDVNTGNSIRLLEGHDKSVGVVAFAPDGKNLLSGADDKSIIRWNTSNYQSAGLLAGHKNRINDLVVSSDGKYIASGSNDNTLILWEASNGKLLRKFDGLEVGNMVESVSISPDSKWVAAGTWNNFIKIWNLHNGLEVATLRGHNSSVKAITFSPDGNFLISASWDNTIRIWSTSGFNVLKVLYGHKDGINDITISPDGRYILSGSSDQSLKLWDFISGKELKTFYGHTGQVRSVQFSPDGRYCLSGSDDGTIKVWDVEKCRLIYSAAITKEGEGIFWTPDGFFEGSPQLAREAVYVQDGLDIILLDQLFEKHYQPGIIATRMQSKEIPDEIKQPVLAFELPPQIKITSPQPDYISVNEQINITITATDMGGGVDEIRLYHNGKLIDGTQRGFKPKSSKGNSETLNFNVYLADGENHFHALAYSQQRVESLRDQIVVHHKATSIGKPSMHIISVALNEYANPRYNLNYAISDSEAFVDALDARASGIFSDRFIKKVYNSNATKSNIKATIDSIRQVAKFEDVFVFYYAGHGVMSSGMGDLKSEFFLVPHDITKMYDADDLLMRKGISASELAEISKSLRPQKQLFILDACQSGGALQSMMVRGAAEEKAIAQLSRSTGTFIIAASGSEQYATEVETLGHGIFTYSILQAFQGACKSLDGRITVNLLKACIEDLVPELSRQHKGQPQFPTGYGFGQDFPIGIVR